MKKTKKKNLVDQIKGHTKAVAGLVATYGVAQIMGNVMKDYQPDAKGAKKLLIKIGAAAITGAVIKMVTDYIDDGIDEVFEYAEMGVALADKQKDREGLNEAS